MRTTLEINNRLLARAKALAVRESTTLTRLIEEGLTLRLRPVSQRRPATPVALPVHRGKGGIAPGVDALSNRAMFDAADGESDG